MKKTVLRASRKVIALLLSCAVLLSLTACSVTPTSDSVVTNDPTPSTSTVSAKTSENKSPENSPNSPVNNPTTGSPTREATVNPVNLPNPGSSTYVEGKNSPRLEPTQIDVANAVFGQKVYIGNSATYYASADYNGSGASAQAYNVYMLGDLYIGGFAIVKDGRLADYEAYLRDNVRDGQPAPSFCQDADGDLWCFIYTDEFATGSIGWFRAKDVYYPDPDGKFAIAIPVKDGNSSGFGNDCKDPGNGENVDGGKGGGTDDGLGTKNPDIDPYLEGFSPNDIYYYGGQAAETDNRPSDSDRD